MAARLNALDADELAHTAQHALAPDDHGPRLDHGDCSRYADLYDDGLDDVT
ncbi:hypothetical protein OG976_09365 [Mycobacterium sp. NBC_00419]|uniref:hypothetical protein n=1 Tax=Mycobacterium sp. NBC_00419 TaxID=2975989 RepID=UPI002E231004